MCHFLEIDNLRESLWNLFPRFEKKMLNFLQLISSTQSAIKLQIGFGKKYVDCRILVERPEFSNFVHQYGTKIKALRINCCAANFEKFYNDNLANLENLAYLRLANVHDKVL